MACEWVDAVVTEILTSVFAGIGASFFGGTLAMVRRIDTRVSDIGERVARIEGKLDKR